LFSRRLSRPDLKAIRVFRYEAAVAHCIPYRTWYFKTHGVETEEGLKAPCEHSQVLVSIEECEIDHAYPMTFKAVLMEFVEAQGLDLNEIPVQEVVLGEGRGSRRLLACPTLRASWLEHHFNRAQLRVLDPEVHLRLTQATEMV
jgi:hypothetical protein